MLFEEEVEVEREGLEDEGDDVLKEAVRGSDRDVRVGALEEVGREEEEEVEEEWSEEEERREEEEEREEEEGREEEGREDKEEG